MHRVDIRLMLFLLTIIYLTTGLNDPVAEKYIQRNIETLKEHEVEELARVIEWEARGETEEGQLLVAHVVINRMKHGSWPDTITGVIYQRNQFTVTRNPRYRASKPETRFYYIAAMAMHGAGEKACCENLVYFSRGKAPYMKDAFKLGNHWFGHKGACIK